MANYDDIFNASQSVETDEKSYSSFDKEEWAAQKKQEREDAFALIDTTAEHMANDGALFRSYLDVQAHFDRYSVGIHAVFNPACGLQKLERKRRVYQERRSRNCPSGTR